MKGIAEFVKSLWWWNALIDLLILLSSLYYLGAVFKAYEYLIHEVYFLLGILLVSFSHLICWFIILMKKLAKRRFGECLIIFFHIIFLILLLASLGPHFLVIMFIGEQ
jgi:hypothetical protein